MEKTVAKCLRLIEALGRSERPSGLSELARALALGKSNVHRLLDTLVQLGYVRRLDDQRKYELTLKTWEIGITVLQRLDVRGTARTHLAWLAEKTGETVHLSVLDGGDVIYIDKIDGRHPVRAYSEIGGRAPAYCVATGKALLSGLSDDAIRSLYGKLVAHTPRTLASHSRLLRELNAIRLRGYAINSGEWRAEVCGAGAPIYDANDRIVAAVGISGPAERLRPRQLSRFASNEVLAAAARISLALGQRRGPARVTARATAAQGANGPGGLRV